MPHNMIVLSMLVPYYLFGYLVGAHLANRPRLRWVIALFVFIVIYLIEFIIFCSLDKSYEEYAYATLLLFPIYGILFFGPYSVGIRKHRCEPGS